MSSNQLLGAKKIVVGYRSTFAELQEDKVCFEFKVVS